MSSLMELNDDIVRSMSIAAVFSDFVSHLHSPQLLNFPISASKNLISICENQGGKIHSLDFHRKDDLLVTASEDDSVRLFDISNARYLCYTNSFLFLL